MDEKIKSMEVISVWTDPKFKKFIDAQKKGKS